MSHYVIRLDGWLSTGLTSAFPSLVATRHAQTLVLGRLDSQASLGSLLRRLENLGVDIAEIRKLTDHDAVKSPLRSTRDNGATVQGSEPRTVLARGRADI